MVDPQADPMRSAPNAVTSNGDLDEYGLSARRSMDSRGTKDHSVMVKLPFAFPVGINDSTDVASIVASECMRSTTRVCR